MLIQGRIRLSKLLQSSYIFILSLAHILLHLEFKNEIIGASENLKLIQDIRILSFEVANAAYAYSPELISQAWSSYQLQTRESLKAAPKSHAGLRPSVFPSIEKNEVGIEAMRKALTLLAKRGAKLRRPDAGKSGLEAACSEGWRS